MATTPINEGVREIFRIVSAHKQREGDGFAVRRPFPSYGLTVVDPFLLIDEMGPVDYAPGEAVARYGPFVMNNEAEIDQAVQDHQSGRMGEITRTAEVASPP